VDELHAPLLSLARTFTSSPSLAEDIVQETWLGVIRGLGGFEGRSTLRTWIFSILIRRARTMAAREARRGEVSIEPWERDEATEWQPGNGRIGLWEGKLVPWGFEDPAAVIRSNRALEVLREAVDALPTSQRRVVILRDIENIAPADICNILGVSETNLRVLLHRGRARIRRALDRHLQGNIQGLPGDPRGSTVASRGSRGPSRAHRETP